MWHVIAPVVRWPLHNPRRLAAVLLTALVLIVGAGKINSHSEPATEGVSAAPTRTDPSSTSSSVSSMSSTPTPATPTSVAATSFDEHIEEDVGTPEQAAAATAAGFVTAWARPDMPQRGWLAGLGPIVTSDFLAQLSTTDVTRVPAVQVSSAPVIVASAADSAVIDVPTTGEYVRVHLAVSDDAWLVSSIELVS